MESKTFSPYQSQQWHVNKVFSVFIYFVEFSAMIETVFMLLVPRKNRMCRLDRREYELFIRKFFHFSFSFSLFSLSTWVVMWKMNSDSVQIVYCLRLRLIYTSRYSFSAKIASLFSIKLYLKQTIKRVKNNQV